MKTSPIALIILGTSASALAQPGAVLPPPPAPPVMTVPFARPADASQREQERRQIASFEIEVRAGKDLIWSGNLRASGRAQGEYNQSKREPFEACPGDGEGTNRYPGRQNELRISLSRPYDAEAQERFGLTVNWARPVDGCESQGSRSVAFQQTFVAAVGQTRRLAGDGGLEVTVTRRR